jgi:hypothetical protein
MMAGILIALLNVPIVWWRNPYGGLDGHGTSPEERCEGSPESSEVSALGKQSVFSNHQLGQSDFLLHGFASPHRGD